MDLRVQLLNMAWSASLDPFPFPIEDALSTEVGPNTVYPVGLTLEELFLAYHRQVYKVVASVGGNFTVNSGSASFEGILSPCSNIRLQTQIDSSSTTTITDIAEYTNSFATNAEASFNALGDASYLHIQLNVQDVSSGSASSSYSALFPDTLISNNASVNGSWNNNPFDGVTDLVIGLDFTQTKHYDGLYYPYFRVSIGIGDEGLYGAGAASQLPGSPTVVGSGTFLGKTFSLYQNIDSYAHAPSTLDVEITVGGWHPHDPGDTASYSGKDGSGPIYDITDGTQLRDPSKIDMLPDGTFYNPYA